MPQVGGFKPQTFTFPLSCDCTAGIQIPGGGRGGGVLQGLSPRQVDVLGAARLGSRFLGGGMFSRACLHGTRATASRCALPRTFLCPCLFPDLFLQGHQLDWTRATLVTPSALRYLLWPVSTSHTGSGRPYQFRGHEVQPDISLSISTKGVARPAQPGAVSGGSGHPAWRGLWSLRAPCPRLCGGGLEEVTACSEARGKGVQVPWPPSCLSASEKVGPEREGPRRGGGEWGCAPRCGLPRERAEGPPAQPPPGACVTGEAHKVQASS